MKRLFSGKRNKIVTGSLIILLSILYLAMTSVFAQDNSYGPAPQSGITYNRDDLSWGDVWKFDSSSYQASNYSKTNSAKTFSYATSSQGTESSTLESGNKGSHSGWTYYGEVTANNKSKPTGEVKLEMYSQNKFISNYNTSSIAAPIGIDGITIPVATTTGTGVYSVVPAASGNYRIFVYSEVHLPRICIILLFKTILLTIIIILK